VGITVYMFSPVDCRIDQLSILAFALYEPYREVPELRFQFLASMTPTTYRHKKEGRHLS